MSLLGESKLRLSRWMDDVAWAAVSMGALFRPIRKFQIVEQEDSGFQIQATKRRSPSRGLGQPLRLVDGQFVEPPGSRSSSRIAGGQVELVLAARRFVFRSVELPRQASGFLDGIVRAQIDKLTPWTPAQAAFGCGAPTEMTGGRVSVAVAATALSQVVSLAAALETLKPDSIAVSVAAEGARDRIVVFAQQAKQLRRMRRLRRFLVAAPVLAGFAAAAALATWIYVGDDLEASRVRVARQVAERRVALANGRGGVAEEAVAALEKKKRETPATVVVLESLSKALPDDTHLLDLQVADGKLQISGVTREAASLIGIIEQTDQFKHATFFAPTTRAAHEPGEQFHIEAQIIPYFPVAR